MTRSSTGTFLALMLGRVAFGYQLQTVASLGPDLVAAYRIDFAQLGSLMGAYMLPGVLVAIPCGFVARRFGEYRVMCGGLLLMILGSLASALADAPLGIGVGRAISGVGAVAITVLQGKVMSDRYEGASFTRMMGLIVGSFPIGIGLAQLTQARLASSFGLSAPFLAGAAMAAASAALFLPTWTGSPHPGARSLALPSRRETLLVVLAGLIWTGYNAGYFNFLAYMPSFLAARGHPHWVADAVMTVATWGNLPAILLGSALIVRFGRTPVFMAGTLLCAASVAGPVWLDLPLLWGLMFGTLAAIHGGLIIEIGTLSARPENRAVGMGLFYTTYFIGGSIVPALCGLAADTAGSPAGALLCASALSLAAVPVYLAWRRAAAR